jgi:UDP-N-acetylmuramoyl-L-alanyl-D-glutamate--2,6-diaminopimelate ligase
LLSHLAAADESLRLVGDARACVGGIAYDVRDLTPGDLFAAIDGAAFRGHDVAVEAVGRGAAALLVDRELALDVPMLVGADPAASLARVSAAFHGHPSRDLRVIGITGTDGKTTTTHLAHAVLRAAGTVAGCISTIGVRIGEIAAPATSRLTTPESPEVQRYLRQMVDAGAEWAVLEATSHGLALNRLDEVRFEVGAVTNVTSEHLDFHGNAAAYREAKGILFRRVADADGVVVVNAGDPGAMGLLAYAGRSRVVRYGFDRSVDVRAVDMEIESDRSRFVLETADDAPVPVELGLPGRFNVENALCAAACALAAEIRPETIAAGLSTAEPVPGRMMRIDARQPFAVVVDFAHTPRALEQVLRLLRKLHPDRRLIVVVGSAGDRDRLKRPQLGEVSARGADYSVFTSEDPRHEDADTILAQIAVGALVAGGREGETFVCVVDRREAIQHALSLAEPGDCVVLAGKGHERSMVWGADERAWDEAAVARAVLAELGYRTIDG